MSSAWLAEAVRAFGKDAAAKLAGPGDREAAIRTPLEHLLSAAGEQLNVNAVFHDEVRDAERRVRPDYALSVDKAISGYVEVKAPGRSIDPDTFTGHDLKQWERQRDLPNLVYTNGTEWRLYRDGASVGEPVSTSGGPLATAGEALAAGDDLELLLTQFLRWKPAPITSVGPLVRAIAPLTRLLYGEVLDQLETESAAVRAGGDEDKQPFLGLARDWRALLFPHADDTVFADGYAQTVTFALLLARTEGIDVAGSTLHEVGDKLGSDHSLMGAALKLLTDSVAADFRVTLDLLVRVIGAVQWEKVRKGRRDAYLHLYENFLGEYDETLRKKSGSYYTPRPVVDEMTRLTEDALRTRMGVAGLHDEAVRIVDPAMGTGTFLHTIIERVAARAEEDNGPGIVPGTITDLVGRLVGFELQMGPYAVAELRTTDLLRDLGATTPPNGLQLYVTDTLDDPHGKVTQLASTMAAISRSRKSANVVKADTPVTVVIGNPPYRERAEGQGGWIESGDGTPKGVVPLSDFKARGNGRNEYVLKNLYVYFWRWATQKVFDDPKSPAGVVCFITTSGYLRGPGFKGMREYLRRTASEGWIVDLTPEGQTPEVPTRIFPGVRQPLAIGLFVRTGEADATEPATIHYRSLEGKQAAKFDALASLGLDDDGWREARTAWQAPFTPAAETAWDSYPALSDLFPFFKPGVKPNRTWPYAPARSILQERWSRLVGEADPEKKRKLFKESTDNSLLSDNNQLPGPDVHEFSTSFASEARSSPTSVQVGFRAFDRQWLIADGRVINRPRPELWAARIPGQAFLVEQHAEPLPVGGPGVLVSALIPDMHHFNNRGGRTLPMLHPDGSPNLAPGLLDVLRTSLGRPELDVQDVVAYILAVTAHPGYTDLFNDELTTPGIRVPFTASQDLWDRAVAIGTTIGWLHSYGKLFSSPDLAMDQIRYAKGDERQPLPRIAISELPDEISYDEETQTLTVGTGTWSPVRPEAEAYAVGGRNVIHSWFGYRKKDPGGRRSSELDDVHAESWPTEWTQELTDLLTVLTRLTELEQEQADLLADVLAGDLSSTDALAAQGVAWPVNARDRRPKMPVPTHLGDAP